MWSWGLWRLRSQWFGRYLGFSLSDFDGLEGNGLAVWEKAILVWEGRREGKVRTVGDGGGDGGVICGDEVSPDGHEGAVEIGGLVRGGGAEVGGYVRAVLGADDGILILVCDAIVVGEGFGHPVGGADEGCFCVEVLR